MRGVENVINCDDVEWTSSSLPQGTSRSINPRPCAVNNVAHQTNKFMAIQTEQMAKEDTRFRKWM